MFEIMSIAPTMVRTAKIGSWHAFFCSLHHPYQGMLKAIHTKDKEFISDIFCVQCDVVLTIFY